MRIAIFSDSFYPELSGISDSIIVLAKELKKLGHEIHFFAPSYSAKDYQKANLKSDKDALGGMPAHRFFSLPYRAGTGQGRLVIPTFWRWLKVKKIKPDIIHSQLFFGVGLEAMLAARFLKIPLIGTNHTAITEFAHYSPIKISWFENLSLNYAVWYYNHCDFVTAPSQSVFTEMEKYGFTKSHQVVSNPIDTITFKADDKQSKESLKKQFNLSANTIVYAGRLAREKNLDVIIKAVAIVKKQIPDINFSIAGHGAAELELKNLIKELKIKNNVKFLGTLDKPTLARLYQASEIFVITSTSETQSLVMLQAMGCGLPVIAAEARALPEYVNETNGLLIESGDFKTLAEKIIYMFKNPTISKNLGQGACGYVQQFSAENIARKWEKLYQQILTNRKS